MTALASALKVRASGDAAQPTRPDLGLATTDLEDAIQAATVHARASGASPHAVRIIAATQDLAAQGDDYGLLLWDVGTRSPNPGPSP